MPAKQRRSTCAIALACITGTAVAVNQRSTVNEHASLSLDLDASEELRSTVEAMATSMLRQDGSPASISGVLRTVSSKLDLKSAARKIEKKLPEDVASLVRTATEGQVGQPFSEASLDKARTVLNGMVETAWKEMDDKIIECKEYEEQNRGTFDQVVTDISRLVEQISDFQRLETEAIDGVSQMEAEILDVEAELAKESKVYKEIFAANNAEMTIRQNDLDVFTFILQFTQCADATSLLQHNGHSKTRICEMNNGQRIIHFNNEGMQSKFNRMLTPSSRKQVSKILGDVEHEDAKRLSLLQIDQPMNTTTALPPATAETPVQGEDAPPVDGAKSCPPTPPDCGLLHDKLSLMWGDYKDKVDELQMIMNKNEFEFEELKMNLNDQIRVLSGSKARFSMQLSEARSNMAADRSEKKEKEGQKTELDKSYYAEMKACKKRITWILYQDMCALIVVRNSVLETSTVCPSASINDCDVDAWIPTECSVSCDDACPDPSDPYSCGGWQQIYRKVVVPADSCGLRCPELVRSKKCNQLKCPVNCEMSEWSGWSKCTADCEGGVQGHTRSIIAKPMNGGSSCNTVEEARPCNTMSCDRDCTLAAWTPWTPCSMACGGGFQERKKHVLIPTRGFGKCPKADTAFRYENQECNVQKCIGDETCVAKQDMLLAIDGSGSLTEDGFGILKSFAVDLLSKYHAEYFGESAMKVGVIEFGNGVIMDTGDVSPAINQQPLTDDLSLVKTALENLPYKKGFTNMAQAFALAEVMYTANGRKGAQSALLVITDGKPSFAFQTQELVRQLDDKGVQRFFMVISESSQEDLKQMKDWASAPWETNFIHVPSLSALQADVGVWSQTALVTFCPMSYSSSKTHVEEVTMGFMKVKEGGYCDARGELLSRNVNGDAECAALAQGAGSNAFLLGTWFRRGYCYSSPLTVDAMLYEEWEDTRVNPECHTEDGWTSSRIFDFYAIMPAGY